MDMVADAGIFGNLLDYASAAAQNYMGYEGALALLQQKHGHGALSVLSANVKQKAISTAAGLAVIGTSLISFTTGNVGQAAQLASKAGGLAIGAASLFSFYQICSTLFTVGAFMMTGMPGTEQDLVNATMIAANSSWLVNGLIVPFNTDAGRATTAAMSAQNITLSSQVVQAVTQEWGSLLFAATWLTNSPFLGTVQLIVLGIPQIVAWTEALLEAFGAPWSHELAIAIVGIGILVSCWKRRWIQRLFGVTRAVSTSLFKNLVIGPAFAAVRFAAKQLQSGDLWALQDEAARLSLWLYLQRKGLPARAALICNEMQGSPWLEQPLESLEDLRKYRQALSESDLSNDTRQLLLEIKTWAMCQPAADLTITQVLELRKSVLRQLWSWQRNALLKQIPNELSGDGEANRGALELWLAEAQQPYLVLKRPQRQSACVAAAMALEHQEPILPHQEQVLLAEPVVQAQPPIQPAEEINVVQIIQPDAVDAVEQPALQPQPIVAQPAQQPQQLQITKWLTNTATGVRQVVVKLQQNAIGVAVLEALTLIIANGVFGYLAGDDWSTPALLGTGTALTLGIGLWKGSAKSLVMFIVGGSVLQGFKWLGLPGVAPSYSTLLLSASVAETVALGATSPQFLMLASAWRWTSALLSCVFQNRLMSGALAAARAIPAILDLPQLCRYAAEFFSRWASPVNVTVFSGLLLSIVGFKNGWQTPIAQKLQALSSLFQSAAKDPAILEEVVKLQPIQVQQQAAALVNAAGQDGIFARAAVAARTFADAVADTVKSVLGEKGAVGLGLFAAFALLILVFVNRERDEVDDLLIWEWVALNRFRLESCQEWIDASLKGIVPPEISFDPIDELPVASANAVEWLHILYARGINAATKYWQSSNDAQELEKWISQHPRRQRQFLQQSLAIAQAELESSLTELAATLGDSKIKLLQ